MSSKILQQISATQEVL